MDTQQTFEVQRARMIYPFLTKPDPADDALIENMKRMAEQDIREKLQAENPGFDVIGLKADRHSIKQDYIEMRDFVEGGNPMDYLLIDFTFALAPTTPTTPPTVR